MRIHYSQLVNGRPIEAIFVIGPVHVLKLIIPSGKVSDEELCTIVIFHRDRSLHPFYLNYFTS